MFHLLDYYHSALTTTVDTDIPALTDQVYYIQNNHFIPQKDVALYAAWASSATALRAKISTPKFRQISPVYIRPIASGATLPAANPNMDLRFFSPLMLRGLEEIQILGTANPGTTEKFNCLLWLVSLFEQAPLGDVYNIRWTSTTAAVANAWTLISPVTFELQLPYGTYAVIDSEHFSTNAIAHRLTFDQQYERPGELSFAVNNSRLPYQVQFGKFGQWGKFLTTNLPRFEVLCNAADAVHEGYIHCVKVA